MLMDSSALFVLGDPDGSDGKAVADYLARHQPSLVITDLIFAETLSLVTKRIGKYKGIEIGDRLLESPSFCMVDLDEKLKQEAWALYKKYKDKDFDFIDATSFVVCRQRGIKEVITLDRHFAQMGFKVHP